MRRGPLVLVATSLASFTANLDNTVVAVALRDVQADLGSSVLGLQGVVTAYTVTLGALLLAGGAAADRFGARRLLLLGLAVFGAASALCASAESARALVAWRAAQGAGAALVLPAGLALLADAYPEEGARRRAVAAWVAVGAAALVAGPVVGGELVARHGWPAVFWVNVPLCAVAALLSLPPRRSSSPGRERAHSGDHLTKIAAEGGGWDGVGAGLACLALGAATTAVVLAGRDGLSGQVLVAVAVAALAVVVLVRVERRAPVPLVPEDLVHDRHFGGALLAAFASALAAFVLLVFVSLFLQLVQDHDARSAGRILLALPVALVVTAAATRRVHAVRGLVVPGLLLAGAGLGGLALALDPDVAGRTVELWLAVVGVGVGLSTAPAVSVALSRAGSGRQGFASASVTAARELGGVVAVAGLGALAVARLTSRLTEVVTQAGVPAAARPAMLDALLRADKPEVRRQLVDAIGALHALGAYRGLQQAATASFVSSTRWVLGSAAVLLLVLALVSAALLRPADD
ncbi:MAG TPA: MFS transporter [Mycobacteriales bacterium]|nr:MFS transporter [Mycobacteriales bacterium]